VCASPWKEGVTGRLGPPLIRVPGGAAMDSLITMRTPPAFGGPAVARCEQRFRLRRRWRNAARSIAHKDTYRAILFALATALSLNRAAGGPGSTAVVERFEENAGGGSLGTRHSQAVFDGRSCSSNAT